MAKHFRKHRGGGGGGGRSNWAAMFMPTIFGAVAMLIALIMFGVGIDQLDTALTDAATYTEQVGLTDIMGIWGLVIFLVLAMAGIGGLVGGAVMGYKRGAGGGWMNVFMSVVMGTVTLIIGLIMFGITNTQLHTAYVTANATTNKASFTGLLSVMTIFGMVIFLAFMSSGIAALAGAGVGAYRSIRGSL